IGIGPGRTAGFLKLLARRYTGIDYSPFMVEGVRRTHPDVDVRLMDMRDLSAWPAETFQFVLATSNVLDAVGHEDRLRTLGEVHRVLAPDGIFAFSSHNRHYHLAGRGPRLAYSRNPITQLLLAGRYLQCWRNHRRVSINRRQAPDYALFDDPGHDFALIHYYITRQCQAVQLDQVGFALLDIVDGQGRDVGPTDDDAASPSLMYVARRKSRF
ncbi:MAG TPA: class I SAM-dependent methyltransferase, partial [Polyangia bacterium]